MASQLEMRLIRQIENESTSAGLALLRAKLACYLARIGEFDRAEAIRNELRQSFGDGTFAKVSILLMLLDGLMLYYKDLSNKARDRIFRANLLSATFCLNELTALTSAWLAHIDFNASSFANMAEEIRKCKEFIGHDDGTAKCRVALVLGDAFLYSGQRKHSQVWYEKARIFATALGDQAAIGALTYNRAALNVQNLRFNSLDGKVSEAEIHAAFTELQSAINYQELAGLKSLEHLLHAARNGINVVRASHSAGSSDIVDLLDSQIVPIGTGEYFILLSDLARCHALARNIPDTGRIVHQIPEAKILDLDEDDKAIIFTNLSYCFDAMNEADLSLKYAEHANKAKIQFSILTKGLARILMPFEDPLYLD